MSRGSLRAAAAVAVAVGAGEPADAGDVQIGRSAVGQCEGAGLASPQRHSSEVHGGIADAQRGRRPRPLKRDGPRRPQRATLPHRDSHTAGCSYRNMRQYMIVFTAYTNMSRGDISHAPAVDRCDDDGGG